MVSSRCGLALAPQKSASAARVAKNPRNALGSLCHEETLIRKLQPGLSLRIRHISHFGARAYQVDFEPLFGPGKQWLIAAPFQVFLQHILRMQINAAPTRNT